MINGGPAAGRIGAEMLATEYTRIPLWREKSENIVGVRTQGLATRDPRRRRRPLADRCLDHRLRRVRAGDAPGVRTMKAFRRRKTHFAARGRRVRRSRRHGDAGRIFWEESSRYFRRHDVVVPARAQPDGSWWWTARCRSRSQPRHGLAPAGRGGDHGRGPRDPRGASIPERARGFTFTVSFRVAAPRAQPITALGSSPVRARLRSRRKSRAGGDGV